MLAAHIKEALLLAPLHRGKRHAIVKYEPCGLFQASTHYHFHAAMIHIGDIRGPSAVLSSGSLSSPIVLCVEAPCKGDKEGGTYHGNGRILRPSVAKVLAIPRCHFGPAADLSDLAVRPRSALT